MKDNLARLQPLALELQGLPDWPATNLPAGLLLYDVLIAQGASRAELEEILGQEVLALVEDLYEVGTTSTYSRTEVVDPTLKDVERTPSP